MWRERIDEFATFGQIRAPLRDLIDGWARAWDSRLLAEKAWDAAGRPETEVGSMGQERRHHWRSQRSVLIGIWTGWRRSLSVRRIGAGRVCGKRRLGSGSGAR